VTLFPTEAATQRTRNRIHERGPRFHLVRFGNPQAFNMQRCVYVESEDRQWSGWFPLEEVQVMDSGVVIDGNM
jgi:hypothetical protein